MVNGFFNGIMDDVVGVALGGDFFIAIGLVLLFLLVISIIAGFRYAGYLLPFISLILGVVYSVPLLVATGVILLAFMVLGFLLFMTEGIR